MVYKTSDCEQYSLCLAQKNITLVFETMDKQKRGEKEKGEREGGERKRERERERERFHCNYKRGYIFTGFHTTRLVHVAVVDNNALYRVLRQY